MKKSIPFLAMLTLILIFGMSHLNAQTILCVDRDMSPDGYTDTWPMLRNALDINGYTYDYWEVYPGTDDGPDAAYMGNYDIVIWFSGETYTGNETMTDNDEASLSLYLGLGGKLFLNAQDYLYDQYESAGVFGENEFPRSFLGLLEVVQDQYQIEPGDPGSIADSASFYGSPGSLAEGLEFTAVDIFTTPTDDGLYIDSIVDHLGQDLFGLLYPYQSPGPVGIQYESDFNRIVFTTLDIAAITDTVVRDILMYRIIDWLMFGTQGIVDPNANNVKLTVSPNPVKNLVTVCMDETMEEISIYNHQGQVLLHKKVGVSSIRLDLGHLPPGIYITKIRTAQGFVTDKIMKR